jgi:hypothetical protein
LRAGHCTNFGQNRSLEWLEKGNAVTVEIFDQDTKRYCAQRRF